MNFRKTVAQHPGVQWACGAVEFSFAAALMILGITPSSAAVIIPITDTITINLGELPQWIVALVAAGGFWKAWRAEEKVSQLGVKIDGMLVDRDKANVTKGEAKGEAAGERIAEAVKEGQRQGAELAGLAAAKLPIAAALTQPAKGGPVPVTDKAAERVAERVATATETLAAVAKETAEKKP